MIPSFDPLSYPYPSKRNLVYGSKGMVCTSQPLAAQAGLEVLKRGGNAVDAAIAAAACLTVVEPTSNGIGGDAFAQVWYEGKLYGLNASGPAPALTDGEKIRKAGFEEIPHNGWFPVTVPGLPAAWGALSKRFGFLPLKDVFSPAIRYAEEGYPVSPTVSELWEEGFQRFSQALKEPDGGLYRPWFSVFAPGGKAPKAGELWRSPLHGETLFELAETGCESFYRGTLAEKIDAFSKQGGGALRKEDLAAFSPEWVEPVSINYRGYDVWEIPPNGHGIVVLMALNLLKQFSFSTRDCPDTIHKQIEAMKLAFSDGQHYIADPNWMKIRTDELLSEAYAEKRARLIGEQARLPEHGDPRCGGTIYLCTADQHGNMVSYIHSNYNGFGSGLVVPGTGIALHNRGANFSLDPGSPNCIAPGKRPYHTIIPGFLTKDGAAVGPFGVMGAFMQPQGQVQAVTNLIDFHMNPQAALDAPRWQWTGGNSIEVEAGFPRWIAEDLLRRGHELAVSANSFSFGRGQMILRQENGVYLGATEPRTDGMVAVW